MDGPIDWASSEIIAVISYLLPGFLAAWIFYGLTAHPRREPFERIVQALIFTAIIQAMTYGVQICTSRATSIAVFGAWSREVAMIWSVFNAVLVGLVFCVFANRDWLHKFLRWSGITKRTSFPSEWFSAFNRDKRYVVLHLDGDRRLHGWPVEWPDSSDSGHFKMCDASWLLEDNQFVPLHTVEELVVPVSIVTMVERLKFPDEITATERERADAERATIELYERDLEDGQQSTRSVPSKAAANNGRDRQSINGTEAANSPATSTTQKQVGRKRSRRRRT